jgi:hypothetical protein
MGIDNGGNGICGVVKAIDEFERESKTYGKQKK